MPFHARVFPELEPFHFRARLNEELHFHLLELAHAEYELPRHYLVAESLAYLCYAEGNFHSPGFLHIKVVDEYALCGFGAQVYGRRAFGRRTHLGFEHKVELAHVGPVARAAYRANDLLVDDDLLEFGKVGVVHCFLVTLVQCVAFFLQFDHTRAREAVLCFVERFAETLGCLGHFLVYLFIVLGYLVLDENISAVTLLRVAVVDERVVESVHVSRGFPNGGVHENRTVEPNDVLVQEHHALPPILLDVVFQFNAVLAVVVNGTEAVVNIT